MSRSQRCRLATVWLSGCSGCHMSLLDLDEWLFELADLAEIVYSPIASDSKTYPGAVDVVLVEGAVATRDNLEQALLLRRHSRWVIAMGDCAAAGNVTALRNLCGEAVAESAGVALDCSYRQLAEAPAVIPQGSAQLPALLERVLPLHRVISVDALLPGCPPSATAIRTLLEPLLRRCNQGLP